ncbi:autotransporter outer membrane beta-barrel domain-containing protein [Acuticoccus kandeliae]|uniref:autotransporter outer membrane beta-barrel domain-containing protein n=1 Tax=Acuticoccus kandeliae TaxID=2073160 RepID=UPI000D3E0849|nr:autotransporter outer membrane beta-barrel domain-containing protein [Acuticoccus kandeliae]
MFEAPVRDRAAISFFTAIRPRAAVISVAIACATLASAQADVLANRGGTYSFDASANTVTATAEGGTTLPVALATGSSTSIEASVGGSLVFDGLPFGPSPQLNGVVNYFTTGECAPSVSCNDVLETLVQSGDIAVTVGSGSGTDSIIATGVVGGAAAPGGLIAASLGDGGFGGAGNATEISASSAIAAAATEGVASGAVSVSLAGSAAIDITGTGTGGETDILTPTMVGLRASSTGGGGSAIYWYTGDVVKTEHPFAGDGGPGNSVSVTTAAGSTISLTETGGGANAAGIDARSIGGAAGSRFSTLDGAVYTVGNGGAAGDVTVEHGGAITVDAGNGFGILAVSIGGTGADTDVPFTDGTGNPGNGGTVDVTVTGTISMRNGGAGVFASSQAGAWTPNGQTTLPSGGDVTVTIEDGASIMTGSENASPEPLAFGVMGLSSGTPAITDLTNAPVYRGTGVSGTVSVTNQGTISTNGPTAIGAAALSIGGNPVVAAYTGGSNTVGDVNTVSGGGCGDLAGGCADVTLSNTGSVTTLGAGSVGLVAISTGGGGIVHNDAPLALNSDGEWASGTALGSNPASGAEAADGGGITINHSGAVVTGDGAGGGIGAIGILAQSIGGGGGLSGGSQAVQQVGDAAGGGGDGATVTVNLTDGATVLTRDTSAVGVLMQSIGGGGGSATNTTGAYAAVGGAGGDGGNGGTITLNTSGTTSITTLGNGAQGALIQSIGGGGGNGGFADSAGIFVSQATGGIGGAGGRGGVATGYNNAGSAIATSGNRASGMVVQSIGGGGGVGGAAISSATGIFFAEAIATGGNGGEGGDGDLVTGINHGTITTGLSPDDLQTIGLGTGGIFYATLEDGTTLTSDIQNGDIDTGEITASVTNVTLSDGTVIANATVDGETVTGTVSATGETFTGTIVSGGIYRGVGTDATEAVVTGLIIDGRWITETGGPSSNGADSDGMVVQSIGGGGGIAGAAAAKSSALPVPGANLVDTALPTASISIANGGAGGAGGDGGGVTAGNYAEITSYGDYSRGILAQSIGGGGGLGGDGTAASTAVQSASFDLQISIGGGGDGGGAGDGATVTAFNGASDGSEIGAITTSGQFSPGIVAQSIGGGGGSGGAGSATMATPLLHYDTGMSLAMTFGIGGAAGSTGNGEAVYVYNYAGSSIATTGSTSYGIFAQSIGGGGGDAGGASATGGGDTFSPTLAVGGTGGAGGTGGIVNVENDGAISTAAGSAHGIFAQSIGGGGGSGGTADAAASSLGVYTAYNHVLSSIQNWVTKSAQSYNANIAVGGDGGSGNDGGRVNITNTGVIGTAGSQAYGVLAQSIGGGGGHGAAATATSRSATPAYSVVDIGLRVYTVNLTAGGSNAAEGDGGTVDVTHSGTISTAGFGAHAIAAQSIGGGGGIALDGSVDSDTSIQLGVAVTGMSRETGETSSTGGDVSVTSTGAITTAGRGASGIVAQSVSSGGGIAAGGTDAFETIGGGLAGTATHTINVAADYRGVSETSPSYGAAGAVSVAQFDAISTPMDWAHGIVAQSVGGSGGIGFAYASDSVDVALAMQVGSTGPLFGAGNGGAVDVQLAGGDASTIVTGSVSVSDDGVTTRTGYAAFGVLAQSIGGGGGLGMENNDGGTAAGSTLSIGGSGKGGGGNVTYQGDGSITTHGDVAHAVVLQSVGGGGGIAGQGSSAASGGLETVTLAMGGSLAEGGGGAVTLAESTLTLSTAGANAYGILAQSIGGGGGFIFAADQNTATPNVAFSSVDGDVPPSDGGAVSLTILGGSTIATLGDGAHAIVAQSIGGGGGILGLPTGAPSFETGLIRTTTGAGDGGDIDLAINADISTAGDGAFGVIAQSLGGGGGLITSNGVTTAATGNGPGNGGMVEIQLAGSVTTSGDGSTGIFAQSESSVGIEINAAVAGGSGGGYGVWVDGGAGSSVTIDSMGAVSALSGNAILQTGDTALDVDNQGTLMGSVALNGGTLTNDAAYLIGAGATVDGNFTQSAAGFLAFDFTRAEASATGGLLAVSGTASLDGALRPNVFTWLLPEPVQVVESGALSGRFASVESASPLFGWEQETDATRLTLTATADFTPAGISGNAAALGGYLQKNWDSANEGFSEIFAILYNETPNPARYARALDRMSPASLDILASDLASNAGEVLGTALSCPQFEGESSLVGEGRCVWMQGGGSVANRYDLDTRVDRFATAIGGQGEIASGWYLGGALRTDFVDADGDTIDASGTNYYGTVALKRVAGPWLFAGSIAAGIGDHSLDREDWAGGTLSSDPTSILVGGRLRAAYSVDLGGAYVRPMADLDLFHVHTPEFTERGASPFAWTVRTNDETNVAITPSIELGIRRDIAEDTVLRGYLKLGATYTPTSERHLDTTFAGSGGGDVRTNIDAPDLVGALTAGVQVYQGKGFDLRGEYDLSIGEDYLSQGGRLRLSYRF